MIRPAAFFFTRAAQNRPVKSLPFIYRRMAPANILSDGSDSGEDVDRITINEHFAKAYAYRKERQELERRKRSQLSSVLFTIFKLIRVLSD